MAWIEFEDADDKPYAINTNQIVEIFEIHLLFGGGCSIKLSNGNIRNFEGITFREMRAKIQRAEIEEQKELQRHL